MSRNSNRIDADGIQPVHSEPPVEKLLTEEPGQKLFSLPLPTDMVELPTEGKFYPKDHPLHEQKYIEIRQMTTKDEEILTSKTLVKTGTALDKMLQGLVLDSRVKVDDLYLVDKNALVIAARRTNYGSEYKVGVACPSCGAKHSKTFQLDALEIKPLPDSPELPPEERVEISEDATFNIKLSIPNRQEEVEYNVECKLLNGNDEKSLRLMQEKKKKYNTPESPIRDLLKKIIVSINGEGDSYLVSEFVDNMPAFISKKFREEYERIAPNVDLNFDFECEQCGEESRLKIPFTARFFWS